MPSTTIPADLLTRDEVAEALNISQRMATRLIAERRLTVVKIGRHVRVPRSALAEYIAANTRAAQEVA